jgi:hypothetical protein
MIFNGNSPGRTTNKRERGALAAIKSRDRHSCYRCDHSAAGAIISAECTIGLDLVHDLPAVKVRSS